LNVYKKELGKNYLVKEMSRGKYDYEPLPKDEVRGLYVKNFFEPNLFTKKITMNELNRIALKEVIRSREWSANSDFMCRHFAFEFVLSIVDEPEALYSNHT
jgi:hypothetical protein